MKFSNLSPFVLVICILTKKIECIVDCRPRSYYSVDIPGCTPCPINCGAQDARDVHRCRKACETKTTVAPTFSTSATTIEVEPTSQLTTPIYSSTFEKTTAHPPKPRQSKSTVGNSTDVGLAVSLGVLGTVVVCLVALVVYVVRRCHSTASHEGSGDLEAQVVETGGEPSTSSKESSPTVTKRTQSCQDITLQKIEGMGLPLQETEKLIPVTKDDSHTSSLNLDECES